MLLERLGLQRPLRARRAKRRAGRADAVRRARARRRRHARRRAPGRRWVASGNARRPAPLPHNRCAAGSRGFSRRGSDGRRRPRPAPRARTVRPRAARSARSEARGRDAHASACRSSSTTGPISPSLAGADLVHVGQDDLPVPEAARLGLPVGLSTHAPAEIDAAPSSTDYIGVGPVFSTPTKPGRPAVGLELVRYAAEHAPVPWFAIGGIDRVERRAWSSAQAPRASRSSGRSARLPTRRRRRGNSAQR